MAFILMIRETVYRKPGKIGATTRAIWVKILQDKEGLTEAQAELEFDRQLQVGKLIQNKD